MISELKFSREQGFFDKSLVIRLLISILFVFSLFSFLHFREVRVEILELGSIAPYYVVAQVDTDFYDEEATIILKQEAVRDIGKIYHISNKEPRERQLEFENFLIKDQQWRKALPNITFEEMYSGAESLEKALVSVRFTDPRTLARLKEVNLESENYLVFTPSDLNESVLLPDSIWQNLIKDVKQETVEFILSFFSPKTWKIEEDIPAQRNLRRKIQGLIPDKYTHINAGSRIIDQGEKVTSRHVAIMQAVKEALGEKRNLWSLPTLVGSFILAVLFAIISAVYVYINYPEVLSSNRKLFLLVTIIILTLFIAKSTELLFLSSKTNLIELIRYPLFVPFAAILLCSLMNPSIAGFAAGFLTILMMMVLSFERQGFMIMNLIASMVAIISARSLFRRKEIFVVCAKAWFACIAVLFSLHLYENTHFSGFLIDVVSAGGFMLMTAVLVVGLMPLLESSFRVMTDVTLMEYMDPNHDLLRRLSIEAPGTYQHSVVVGNLAEAAALSIGANGLFCRAATLYHDVGKMATPQYFTENQHGGMNIHQLLTPSESAQVIIAHVGEGVSLARKAGLPEQFIDVIKEHHGTTLVYYFYRKELEQVGGDESRVDENHFRYSGPKPRSKESAIIMLADSFEAASRSLEVMNEESLRELCNRIIRDKNLDEQFNRCLLSLEELFIVKETLIKTLLAYGHARVKYPKRDLGEEAFKDDE